MEIDVTSSEGFQNRQEAAGYLVAHIPAIMAEWETRVRASIPASAHQDELQLRNNLPGLLSEMAHSLTQATGSYSSEDLTAAREHADQRAGLSGYSLDQVIQVVEEYRQLRIVLMNVFDAQKPFDRDVERDMNSCLDLTGANLTGANLTRANLSLANLTRAVFTGANLRIR